MGQCKDCRWWEPSAPKFDLPYGTCRKIESDPVYEAPYPAAWIVDYEHNGWLNTMPEFGCAAFESKLLQEEAT